MTTDSSEGADAGAAFRRLLTALGGMADVVDREAGDDLERAEGYRHLLRLLSATDEWFVEKSDTMRPAFTTVMTPWRKFIGDNPDTLYDVAPVAAGTTYRLRGRRNDAIYLGITIYGRDPDGGVTFVGQLADDAFIGDDGTFDVHVGGPDPGDGRPWLPLGEHAESLWVRQYFEASDHGVRADLDIEVVGDIGAPPPLDEHALAAALDRVSVFMADTLDSVTTLSRMMARQPNAPLMAGAEFAVDGDDTDPTGPASELEELLLKMSRTSYPTPDNRYAGVWFELEEDEALVVTARPPEDSRYWGLQLANRWQESLDYRKHQVCLNDRQITLEADGSYRVVVSAVDPGATNWLDTAGHRSGMVNVRALLADELADPSFTVVPLASLRAD